MLLDEYKGEQFGESVKEGEGEFWKDVIPSHSQNGLGSLKDLEQPDCIGLSRSRLAELLNALFD